MSAQKVLLASNEGDIFKVDEEVALESQILKPIIEDMGIEGPLPLPLVSSEILGKVIEYCTYHVESRKVSEQKPAVLEEHMQEWDADFIKVPYPMLLGFIEASNYMEIPKLPHLSCAVVAERIKKCLTAPDPEREIASITRSFSPS